MGKPISATCIFCFTTTTMLMMMMMLVSSSWGLDGNGWARELGLYSLPAAATATMSTGAPQSCNGGSIEECLAMETEEEEEEEGERGRRVLYWRRRYISYGALFRDRVPCSRRGYSYYNCRPGRPVNPYVRGCSAITRCRSF